MGGSRAELSDFENHPGGGGASRLWNTGGRV